MNGSAVTLDKVEIQISASAGKASSNISQLTETLSALRSATKGGFNNLSKLAESLEQLKTASESLDVVKQNLSNIIELTNSLQRLSDIPAPRGLNKIINNIQSLPEAFSNINTSSLENVTRVSNQLSDALTPLSNKLADIASGYSAVSKLADTYGVSITKIREYTKQSTNHTKAFSSMISNLSRQLKNGQKANENFFKSLSKNASSVISKIKQIGLSLLGTRTIFTATRKAVSEYMNMDAELTWKIANNWKALGAQLAPAIENVTWLFKQFIRVIYSIILALTGVDLIARANEKAMKGWGKSAKDTLGNLQKFDDLNVVEFPKGTGDNSLIELDPIDLSPIQKVIDWVKKLRDEIKKALDTKKWSNVGKVFAKGLNGAMKAIDFDFIEEKFTSVASKFGDFLRGVVSEFDWSLFGEKLTRQLSLIPRMIITFLNNIPWGMIGQGINDALKTFDPYILIDAILGSINTLILGIQSALLRIDGSVIGEKISDTLIAVQNNINNLLANIKWGAMWDNLTEAFNNINWEQIGENLATSINLFFKNFEFGKLLKTVTTFVHGLFTTISTVVSETDWSKIGENIVDAILDIDIAQLAIDVARLLDKIIDGIADLFIGMGKSLWKKIYEGLSGKSSGRKGMGGDSDVDRDSRTLGEKFIDGFTLGALQKAQSTNGISRVLLWIGGFIQGFFGIHSPSTWARDEIGKNISLGFANGLSNMWADAKKYFEDFIKNITNTLSSDVFKKIAKDAIDGLSKGFDGLSSALKKIFKEAFNGAIGIINNVIDKVNNKLSISVSSTLASILSTLGVKVNGGKYQLFSIPKIPALETGTNRITYEGLYHLHPDEAVVPKKYNPALGNGTNEETNSRLDRLIDILENTERTTIVNIGNKELLKQQQKYNKAQNDKYGTDIIF